jgi:hypothetical protein
MFRNRNSGSVAASLEPCTQGKNRKTRNVDPESRSCVDKQDIYYQPRQGNFDELQYRNSRTMSHRRRVRLSPCKYHMELPLAAWYGVGVVTANDRSERLLTQDYNTNSAFNYTKYQSEPGCPSSSSPLTGSARVTTGRGCDVACRDADARMAKATLRERDSTTFSTEAAR